MDDVCCRVRRSQLHLEKLVGLLAPLQGCEMLTELDLSHCYLGDTGMQVVAAFLAGQPQATQPQAHASLRVLRVLRVSNNKFGTLFGAL